MHAPDCGVQCAEMLSIAAYEQDVLHGITRFSVSFTQSSCRQLQMTTYKDCSTVAADIASTPGARRSKACHMYICRDNVAQADLPAIMSGAPKLRNVLRAVRHTSGTSNRRSQLSSACGTVHPLLSFNLSFAPARRAVVALACFATSAPKWCARSHMH